MDLLNNYRNLRLKIESLLIDSNNNDLIAEINEFEKNLTESETLYTETTKIAKIGGWKVNLKKSELEWTKEKPHRVFILGANGCGKTTLFKILKIVFCRKINLICKAYNL